LRREGWKREKFEDDEIEEEKEDGSVTGGELEGVGS